MAFTDPIALTINGVGATLPKTSVEGDDTTYQTSDGLIVVRASHTYGKRNRHLLRIDHSKITADPFIPSENVKRGMSNYLVFDLPDAGYTPTEALQVYQGFKTWFTATSDAVITKLLGGES
jgi:hypothetical protein|uniref:Uncharacterized protein n=1 Tax=Leviviridae sp. TaxID=2027243 RepID=A0A514D5B2_9VIRU|nr:MAG: hypothetical protein H3BulkL16333e3931_000003 [Leviviridae sp.]